MPPLTPAGQQRAEARREYAREHPADSWVDFSAWVRCILGFNAGPPITPSVYNNNMQLFQTPDHVVIVTEMVHTARVVPLDGRSPLSPDIRQWSGDSRGYWEGETLVIETRNFADKRRWRGTTEDMHLVERLTRVDTDTLVYEFTVTDPETWTSSWTASVPMVWNPEPMYEFRVSRRELRHDKHPRWSACRRAGGDRRGDGFEMNAGPPQLVTRALS